MAKPQTATGGDPFAGAPGEGGTATPADPTADPTSGAMPSFTPGSGSSSKTFGGVPVSQMPTTIGIPAPLGIRSPEDQPQAQTIDAYKDGDQWAPASDPNPDTVRDLQVKMVNAGLLTLKQVHLGIWDATSAGAYAKVLAQANLMGVPAEQALDQYVASEASLPKAGLSPEDLKGIAQQAAQQYLGRDMNADEIARFSTAFQSALATDQPTTAAGTQQVAEDTLKKENPKGVMAASLHTVSQKALQILSQPAVSLPGVQ